MSIFLFSLLLLQLPFTPLRFYQAVPLFIPFFCFLSSSFLFLTASSIDVDVDAGAGSSSSASTRSRPIAIPRSRQNSVASTVTIPEALSARGERQGCV